MTDDTKSTTPPANDASAGEVRVSTIVGDRLCIQCGFNLTGQPVTKEPRYGLFIARCPECGSVASLQEYPVLGKWANRWAALAAALWLAILIAASFAFAGIVTGTSYGALEEGSRDFGDWVSRKAATDETSGLSEQAYRFYTADVVDVAWWESLDHWALLREAGGFRAVVLSEIVGFWFGLLIGGIAFGIVGSVALLHARRLRLAIVLLLPMALAATFQTMIYTAHRAEMSANTVAEPDDLTFVMLAPLILLLTDLVVYTGVVIGAMIGRPTARGLMRAFLPPRLRSSLAFLWLADGKTPPKP